MKVERNFSLKVVIEVEATNYGKKKERKKFYILPNFMLFGSKFIFAKAKAGIKVIFACIRKFLKG